MSLYAADLDVAFTGDTLFNGGPRATGRSFSNFDTIIDSIRTRLLTLPPESVVHTGHGDSTSIDVAQAGQSGSRMMTNNLSDVLSRHENWQ